MLQNLKEADITYKARGSEFEFIKIVFLDEKENCSMKIQEVVFGDFKMFEVPKKDFLELVASLDNCKMAFPSFSNGKAGNQYQLEIQSGENAMNYKWYGDSPGEQWKDIIGFASKLVELKNKFL